MDTRYSQKNVRPLDTVVKLKAPTCPSYSTREENKSIVILAKQFNPSEDQIKLLNKELTFIPTTGISKKQKEQMREELQLYHQRLKLEAFF